MIKEEESHNDSTDRTHFVLVTKPKFIKVESGNDNTPASPRKTQNVTLEPEDDEDVALMKNSQSSDDGTNFSNSTFQFVFFVHFFVCCVLFRHSTETLQLQQVYVLEIVL